MAGTFRTIEQDQDHLSRLVNNAVDSSGGAVVVSAAPGAGKTSLLEWIQAVAIDANLDVRFVTGSPVRHRRPYAAIRALLLGGTEQIDTVAADPVLAAVCGLVPRASPPQGIVVGSALLSHFSALAEERPIVLVIDDLAWIDTSSATALLFAARRLVADRVAMVFSMETIELSLAERTPQGFSEVDVRGLDRIELSVARNEPQINLLKLYLDRIDALAPHAQKLLLAAAIDDDGRLLAIYMGNEMDSALREVRAAGLLGPSEGMGNRLRFRHPLMRSSALSTVSPALERRLHATFAGLLENESQRFDDEDEHDIADRIALHRRDGALGTDPEAARLLAEFAQRAQQRGATSESCWALLQAAELTTDHAMRQWWIVEAAQQFYNSGQAVRALALIEPLAALGALGVQSSEFVSVAVPSTVRPASMDVRLEVRLNTLLANASQWERDPQTVIRKVRGEIATHSTLNPSRAAWTYVYLANMAYLAGDIATGIADADQAIALADAQGDYFAGMAGRGNLQWNLFLHADHSRKVYDQPDVQTILAVVAGSETVEGVVAGQGLAMIAIMEERWELADQILPEMAAAARRRGLHSAAVLYDGLIASLHWRRGQWSEAWCLATGSLNEGEQPTVSLAWSRATAAVMAASMGDSEWARHLAGQALSVAHSLRVPMIAAWAYSALGQLELSQGRPEQALPYYQQVASIMKSMGLREPCFVFWHGDWIDALIETSHVAEAEAAIAELDDLALLTGRGWARGVVARGRARLANSTVEREEQFAKALQEFATLGMPFETARTLLARGAARLASQARNTSRIGEGLHDAGNAPLPADGQEPQIQMDLAEALRMFQRLGAGGWEERTLHCLRTLAASRLPVASNVASIVGSTAGSTLGISVDPTIGTSDSGRSLEKFVLNSISDDVNDQFATAIAQAGNEDQNTEMVGALQSNQLQPNSEAHPEPLSTREMRVAIEVAAGRTNKQVSSELYISVKTVEFHLQSIYRKLKVRNRAQFVGSFTRLDHSRVEIRVKN